MIDIAQRAGMQAGSIYYHYSTKSALIEEVMHWGVATANRAVVDALAALDDDSGSLERLTVGLQAHQRAMARLDSVARAHVLVYDQLPEDSKERVRPTRHANGLLWRELIQEALKDGHLREDVTPFFVQTFAVNTIDGTLSWPWRAAGGSENAEALVRMILGGIGVQGQVSGASRVKT
jgi:AcrR family transcriptional regulator